MVFLYIEIVEMWFRIFLFSFAECIVEVHTVVSTFFVFFFPSLLFTPRLRSHGRFVGYCGRDRSRTLPRLAQTRRRSPWVGPAWGRTDSLIRHAPGPDWSRNCSTGAWNCQTRRLGRSWNGSPRWYDAPAVTSFHEQRSSLLPFNFSSNKHS